MRAECQRRRLGWQGQQLNCDDKRCSRTLTSVLLKQREQEEGVAIATALRGSRDPVPSAWDVHDGQALDGARQVAEQADGALACSSMEA